jgi:F0F1-type ATP synthase membrane subunit c/vacuolar-type H+-ATPase subunit K
LAGALFTQSWVVRSLLLLIGVGVTVHLATLKTIRQGTVAGALSQGDAEKERAQ